MSTRQTKSAFTASLCLLLGVALLHAQIAPADSAAAQAQKKLLTDAASAGTPLPATITVSENVNIEAIILPREITRRVFGRNVSQNYVVIEVNISNRSKDAALIIQSLFIDLSRWGFAAPLLASGITSSSPTRTASYNSADISSQVASVEYRIVRGQLQDAQPWTARNTTVRAIKVLGTVGVAFAFPFSTDVVRGIGAWNGAVVPGFEVYFPDGMEAQLNRINDYGFRNNKIIPQQSSDIVIAFFPIDRFLTPTLRKVFLKSPGLFYNPLLMAMDPRTGRLLEGMLSKTFESRENARKQINALVKAYAELDITKIETFKKNIAIAEAELLKAQQNEAAATNENARNSAGKVRSEAERDLYNARHAFDEFRKPVAQNQIFQLFNSLSLSNVHIVVSGAMTIDQLTVPATIESTCFDKAGADFWAVPGEKSCSITGRFLTNGTPRIVDADKLGISDIKVLNEASSDELIKFTFKLKAALDPGTEIDIFVSKPGKNDKVVESTRYRVKSAYTLSAPTITSVVRKDSAITVTGTNFLSNSANRFSASLRPSGGGEAADVVVKSEPPETATSFALDATKFAVAKVPAGCHVVVVSIGTMIPAVSTDKIRIDTAPKLTKATKTTDGKSIQITGEQLTSTKDCGGTEPEFEVLDAANGVITTILLSSADGTSTSATFAAPAVAGDRKIAFVRLKGSNEKVAVQ